MAECDCLPEGPSGIHWQTVLQTGSHRLARAYSLRQHIGCWAASVFDTWCRVGKLFLRTRVPDVPGALSYRGPLGDGRKSPPGMRPLSVDGELPSTFITLHDAWVPEDVVGVRFFSKQVSALKSKDYDDLAQEVENAFSVWYQAPNGRGAYHICAIRCYRSLDSS